MRILIVEDDRKVGAFLQKGLKEEQYAVDVCRDGEEAVEWASINSYDVIVLDIMLPKKDGFTVCRELRQKGIELKMRQSSPSRIRGDRTLLERLLTNLVDNAVRYTPAGGNVVMGVEERDPWLVLTVRETGIGIPEESLPFIFDRFYVVDLSRSKESGGSGLGLSIVKSVADIHGALIDIRSRVEEGTTFTIKFPLAEGRT